MKKLLTIFLALITVLSTALILTGCDQPSVSVVSVMDISPEFSGSRVITVKYPLSADIDAVKDAIIEADPTADAVNASFSYKGVEEDGYYFELSFDFANNAEYEDQISAVIGRRAISFLSIKNTALTKGARMAENFSTADLISWILRANEAEPATKDIAFEYTSNTVNIGAKHYDTGLTADINDVEGSAVSSITIRTSNNKEGSYDRTFVFSVPNDSYIAAKDDFETYFLTNTSPASGYNGWSAEGANMQYTVIFQGLNIDELREYTAMLLDTGNVEISYEDRDNSSTPLSEGLAFEESLDTFSFIGPDKGSPKLIYTYSLPMNTIHGDGAVYSDGRWQADGSWEEGVYKLELSSGSVQLRVPDGIQYAINGINFYLDSLGDERFRRTVDFLYSKTDGYDGMSYASQYFTSRGSTVEIGEDDENLICSLICEGTAAEITKELVDLFGSGNFMSYRKSEGAFDLSVKTSFTDYVNLASILNSSNANRPIRYYISSTGDENLVSVSVDSAESAYVSAEESRIDVKGGAGIIEYKGNIPIPSRVTAYIAAGSALLLMTIAICVLLLRRSRPKKLSPEAQRVVDAVAPDDDSPADNLSQTTTFSIFELGALSRNKKYVEEINKDVEQRMEADRIEGIKKEIRAKELEEMERMVYGSAESDGTENGGEPAPSADTEDEKDV